MGRRNDKCKFQSHILCMYACRVPHATTAFWNNLGILTLSIWTAPHASKLLACNLSKRWGKAKRKKVKRRKRQEWKVDVIVKEEEGGEDSERQEWKEV